MGRGRAKAKQTKVARELKYSTQHTDFEALQRELSNQPPTSGNGEDPFDEDDGYEDDDFRR
jgi:hypothetical protein